MARGFFSGALWGVVVAGLGAGTASVVTGPVFSPDGNAAPQAATPEPDVETPAVAAPAVPQPDTPPSQTPGAPGVAVDQASPGLPAEPGQSGAPELETTSAPVPDTGNATDSPEAPAAPQTVGVDVSEEAPVATQSEAAQPQAPASEELSISTNPAQPPAPAAEEEAPEAVAGEEETPADAVAEEEAVAEQPASNAAEAADPAGTEEPAQPSLPSISAAPAEPEAPETPEAPEISDEVALAPQLGQGASDLSQLAPNIATSRLPSVSAGGEAQASNDGAASPLSVFAVPPETAPDKPLMSIVLVDDGTTPLGLEALQAFPYPLTFAVDTEWEGARAAMDKYRAAGFEVMALANIPVAAQATDVEVALSAALDVVPEAVAIMEGDRAGLQGSRVISDQVAGMLSRTGHGLVLYPKGLGTAVSLAQREGVPAVALFRDFDAQGQNASVIRRFLDQAAFKAGQEGAVIMLGRLRADTISALLIWGLQDRAARVSFVPVSSVLTRGEEG